MSVWFVTIALLGLLGISEHPSILAAVNPLFAVHYLAAHVLHGYGFGPTALTLLAFFEGAGTFPRAIPSRREAQQALLGAVVGWIERQGLSIVRARAPTIAHRSSRLRDVALRFDRRRVQTGAQLRGRPDADCAVGIRAQGLAGCMNSSLFIGDENARAPRCSILHRSETSGRL